MSNWKLVKIGSVVKSFAGGTPSRAREDFYGGNIPWVSSSEVNQSTIKTTKETITHLGLDCSSAKWIPKGTVLIAMYGATAGQVSKLLIKATSNQAVLALVPDEGTDSGFLYYQVKNNKEKLLFLAQGSGQPNLSKDVVDNFQISVPAKKSEQKKIAQVLQTVDGQIEKTEAIIAKYKAIKHGLMQDLFTRGIDVATGKLRPSYQQAPELYKSSPLGMIPKDWDVDVFAKHCTKNGEYGINAAAVPFSPTLPTYLRITDISDEGKFLSEDKRSVNSPESGKYLLSEGDIVFARTGATTGKTYLYDLADGPLVFAGFLIKFSPNPAKLASSFIKDYTETSAYLNWVQVMSMRSGQPGINGNEYGKMLIPLPKIEEQKVISKLLNSNTKIMDKETANLLKLNQLKKGLMSDLLSGKVRVQIDEEAMC